ncbi:MAG: 1-acyl-sn-glycerol-3-phosphate acyltransferase, partial [Ruminococcus sp.]
MPDGWARRAERIQKMNKDKIRYYKEFTDDFEETADQDYKLPEDYRYIRRDFLSRFLSGLIYSLAIVFGGLYCRIFLHTKYKNRKAYKSVKGEGVFVYSNHTQPVGDVFLPALGAFPRRIYVVVSPANLKLPVLGRILPYLGALPLPATLGKMKEFTEAMRVRIEKEKKTVVIYPEAHVWKYYTGIRPFSEVSFKYPVKLNAPVFAQTVTYTKRRFGRKPRATI